MKKQTHERMRAMFGDVADGTEEYYSHENTSFECQGRVVDCIAFYAPMDHRELGARVYIAYDVLLELWSFLCSVCPDSRCVHCYYAVAGSIDDEEFEEALEEAEEFLGLRGW